MTKYTLTTTDQDTARRAMMADKAFNSIWEFQQYLRSEYKYNELLDPVCADYAEELSEKLYTILESNSINMEELYS